MRMVYNVEKDNVVVHSIHKNLQFMQAKQCN